MVEEEPLAPGQTTATAAGEEAWEDRAGQHRWVQAESQEEEEEEEREVEDREAALDAATDLI